DGNGGTATALVKIAVTNAAPVAAADSYTIHAGQTLTINAPGVLANDTDADGDALSVTTIDQTGLQGTAAISADGKLVFTPKVGFTGNTQFSYTVADGNGGTATALVKIAVTNAAPVAAADSYTIHAGQTLTINAPGVLANDTDADGDALSVTTIDQTGLQGTAAISADGKLVFTPKVGFTGNTQFSYTVADGNGGTATALVKIAVTNTAPVAKDDSYTVHTGLPLVINAPGVLANDSDAEGDAFTVTHVDTTGLQGTATLGADGKLTFIAAAGFVGDTQFGYTITDSNGAASTAVVHIKVTGAALVAQDDSYTVHAGQALVVSAPGVLANDSDADGHPFTVTGIDITGLKGTAAVATDGSLVFTPTAGFVGSTQFSYTVSDGLGGVATALVKITVTNAAPTARQDSYTVHAGQQLVISAPGVLANDGDADGDAIAVTGIDTTGLQGSASIDANGKLVFTPAAGFVGNTQFSYTVADSNGATSTALVKIAVTNAAPVAAEDSFTLPAGQPLDIPVAGLLGNDADADGDPLRLLALDSAGLQGTVTLNGGVVRFTPAAGFNGSTSFGYTVGDGLGGTATARVNLQVLPALPTLHVASFQATDTGFRLRFDQAVDASLIQQYGAGTLVPDVEFTGPTNGVQGRVAGSIVFDADGRGFSFVKTGGLLEAGSYQVKLNAGADGFVSLGGLRLDGNGDGVAGDSYARSFTVAAPTGAVLAVQEFARGPGQAASYDPALGAFAITLERGAGFQTMSFDLGFDPALLKVTGATLASGLPAGSTLTSTLVQPGLLRVQVGLGSAIADAALRSLVLVQATVPLSASYGAAEVLRLSNVTGNAGGVRADDGLHVVANLGDADGNRSLQTADVALIQRVAARSDTGFAAYTLIDPTRLVDTNRDGRVTATDAAMVLNASKGLATPGIPAPIAAPLGPVVTRVTPEVDGFSLRFDRAINATLIDAYGAGTTQDLLLSGPSGKVTGSVFFDADGQGLRYVVTNGVLPAGSYSLTLKSGVTGFTALADGQPLDGNADGTTGDDFTAGFTVAAASSPVIGVGNLVAAAGSSNQALSLQISQAAGARSVYFQLVYDPGALHVDAVNLAVGAPAGSVMTVDTSVAGRLGVQLTLGSALPDAALRALVDLRTSVPAGVMAGSSRLLRLQDLLVDGQPARADLGVQLVAVAGDATGNGKVETSDVALIQRVAAKSDTGFAAFPLVDPLLVADLNRDGRITATDAAMALNLSRQSQAQSVQFADARMAALPATESGDTAASASGSPMVSPSSASVATTPAPAPAPVVRLGGALDFGLNAPLPSSTWVNDWVAGSKQTATNDWKLTI
ncbi:Ig-like domain-containing protein, partial [Roseateles cellulosilyticus]